MCKKKRRRGIESNRVFLFIEGKLKDREEILYFFKRRGAYEIPLNDKTIIGSNEGVPKIHRMLRQRALKERDSPANTTKCRSANLKFAAFLGKFSRLDSDRNLGSLISKDWRRFVRGIIFFNTKNFSK